VVALNKNLTKRIRGNNHTLKQYQQQLVSITSKWHTESFSIPNMIILQHSIQNLAAQPVMAFSIEFCVVAATMKQRRVPHSKQAKIQG